MAVLTTRLSQKGSVFEILMTLMPIMGKNYKNQEMALNCRLTFVQFNVFKVEQFKVVILIAICLLQPMPTEGH